MAAPDALHLRHLASEKVEVVASLWPDAPTRGFVEAILRRLGLEPSVSRAGWAEAGTAGFAVGVVALGALVPSNLDPAGFAAPSASPSLDM